MMVKDSFPREGRWESVGLGCYNCQFFKGPQTWPDKNREIYCNFHKVSLAIELRQSNYMEGEWFCKHFKDNGKSVKNAVKHFEEIKISFEEDILYRFEKPGEDLKEIKINELKK